MSYKNETEMQKGFERLGFHAIAVAVLIPDTFKKGAAERDLYTSAEFYRIGADELNRQEMGEREVLGLAVQGGYCAQEAADELGASISRDARTHLFREATKGNQDTVYQELDALVAPLVVAGWDHNEQIQSFYELPGEEESLVAEGKPN